MWTKTKTHFHHLNHMNLPIQISFVTGEKITYLYDASGKKLQKTVWKGSDYTPTDYLSGFQYIHETLDLFPTAEGYVKYIRPLRGRPEQFNYVFNHKDHLGNIRMSYAMDKEKGKIYIMEENHYYPFGLKHEKYNSDKYEYVEISKEDGGYFIGIEPLGPQQRRSYQYKYNGKEFQDELGLNLYDYGARNYDPAIGRWMNMDALSEKYPNISNYVYVANMPTIAFDPDGNEIILFTSSGAKLQYRNGNAYHYGTDKIYKATGSSTIDRVIRSYQKIEASNDKVLVRTLHHLENSDLKHTVMEGPEGSNGVYPAQGSTYIDGSDERTGTDTYFDLSQKRKDVLKENNGVEFTDLDIVVHEMGHQYDYDIGNMGDSDMKSSAKSPTEIRAVHLENIARKIEGNKKRKTYGGEKIDPTKLDNPPRFFPPIYFPEIKFSENIFDINGRHPSAN
ncbi:RHS repeat-associated core domain-containing protein [uncultured Flavobacterium sp.]|uniref:RHS repeat domain-containing protein n=1 Tax=uncultured Flavobacterium sp. TaxID=165435 RepID=UPI00259A0596|nr:RHS repeat-associated core domain-containing protein [uncultured Flavobacterium sp.]